MSDIWSQWYARRARMLRAANKNVSRWSGSQLSDGRNVNLGLDVKAKGAERWSDATTIKGHGALKGALAGTKTLDCT
jgi:hypothetical protein